MYTNSMLIPDEQLKELVVKNGLLDAKGVADVDDYARNSHGTFAQALLEKNVITDENLGMMIANSLKIPFVNLGKVSIPPDVFHIVPEKVARRLKVIAFAREQGTVKLAMTNPQNTEIQVMIAKKTGEKVVPYLATESDITNTFYIFKKDLQKVFDDLITDTSGAKTHLLDAPVARIVDMLIDYAYEDKASDVHIEPQEKESLVRFRIDGILHDVLVFPKSLHDRIITRIKVLSQLRTDEHLSAQDGKMRLVLDDGDLDLRVSIVPIVEGEKIVLRLLSSHSRQMTLIDLGMNPSDLKKVTAGFNKSYGMVLSTGPTGSGKSTSIYAILKILNTREKNITTIEDPVEYRLRGINQIQVNVKTNLTFANGLRSILRQDPNVVFVGEIRDSETAGIAVNAALTGHLVLSTLHTNDAAGALPRLIDMKVEPFLVASTVNVIVAQRLVRKICEMCKTSADVPIQELAKNVPTTSLKKHFGDKKEVRIYKGAGCKICHNTGYTGRLGVFEVLEVSKKIKELISAKADADEILKQALAEGMSSMLDDGLDKVAKGMTTIEEVLRVTKVETL
jgi:type IV pilus assembly protein PilB